VIPKYGIDLYTDEAILEPYEHYRSIRDLGPVVWLEAHNVYAVGRYADARYILSHAELFCSGQGVALNDSTNVTG
jgi:cytochrome P450